MTRRRRWTGGDCCHYDEGYDDGYADAQEEGRFGFDRDDTSDALRAIARQWFCSGRHEEADLLDRLAEEIARDLRIQTAVEAERVRLANLAKLYEAEKAAA